jgi:hypothetical protein
MIPQHVNRRGVPTPIGELSYCIDLPSGGGVNLGRSRKIPIAFFDECNTHMVRI